MKNPITINNNKPNESSTIILIEDNDKFDPNNYIKSVANYLLDSMNYALNNKKYSGMIDIKKIIPYGITNTGPVIYEFLSMISKKSPIKYSYNPITKTLFFETYDGYYPDGTWDPLYCVDILLNSNNLLSVDECIPAIIALGNTVPTFEYNYNYRKIFDHVYQEINTLINNGSSIGYIKLDGIIKQTEPYYKCIKKVIINLYDTYSHSGTYFTYSIEENSIYFEYLNNDKTEQEEYKPKKNLFRSFIKKINNMEIDH